MSSSVKSKSHPAQAVVRSRDDSAIRLRLRADSPTQSAMPQKTEAMAERNARIDHKMAVARAMLCRLEPLDPRTRVLSSAILRRDEVLMDAVFAAAARESMMDLPARVERYPMRRR